MQYISSSSSSVKADTRYTYFRIWKDDKFIWAFHIVDAGDTQRVISVYFADGAKIEQLAPGDIKVTLP
jgi:hypothetical protein